MVGLVGSDTWAGAVALAYGSSSDPTPMDGLTTEPGEPTPYETHTAWWKFTAPRSETVGLDTLGSAFPGTPSTATASIVVYTGDDLLSLTQVAATNTSQARQTFGNVTPHWNMAELDFDAIGGTTYYVQVGGSAVSAVLRVGKRVKTYGDWVQRPDYPVTMPFNGTYIGRRPLNPGVGGVSAGIRTLTTSGTSPSTSYGAAIDAAKDALLSSAAAATTLGQVRTDLVNPVDVLTTTNIVYGHTAGSPVNWTVTVTILAETYEPTVRAMFMTTAPPRDTAQVASTWETSGGMDVNGNPTPVTRGNTYSAIVSAQIAGLYGKWFATKKTWVDLTEASQPLTTLTVAVSAYVLRGITNWTAPLTWDLTNRVKVGDFSFVGNNQTQWSTLSSDFTDCTDQYGRFVMLRGVGTVAGAVGLTYKDTGFSLQGGHTQYFSDDPDSDLTYTLRPPKYRYVYNAIAETAPPPPATLSASPRFGGVLVTWTPVTPIDEYRVTAVGGGKTFHYTIPKDLSSAYIVGLTNGTTYDLTWTAFGAGVESAPLTATITPSASLSLPVGPPPSFYPDILPPAAPALTSVIGSNTMIHGVWTAPPDDGGSPVLGYILTALDSEGAGNADEFGNVLEGTVGSLTNGTTYSVTVSAVNARGRGEESNAMVVAADAHGPYVPPPPLTTPSGQPIPGRVAPPRMQAFEPTAAFSPANWAGPRPVGTGGG